MANGSEEPIGIALLGESRTGKSRVIKALLLAHPPTRTSEGLRAPFLRVTTPAKPTVIALQTAILEQLGDPLFATGTEGNKTHRIRKLFREAGVEALALEEFQHFYDKASHKVWVHAADWLKTLMDDTGIVLIVGGLERCQSVINSNEQLRGRFGASAILRRLDWYREDDRAEFAGIVDAFHQGLSKHFDLPSFESDEMTFRLYCACGGIIGYLSKILRQAVWNAIGKDNRRITIEDLDLAYIEAVIVEYPALQNVRPFATAFIAQPSEPLVAAVKMIGTTDAPPAVPKGPGSAQKPKTRVKPRRPRSSDALSATR